MKLSLSDLVAELRDFGTKWESDIPFGPSQRERAGTLMLEAAAALAASDTEPTDDDIRLAAERHINDKHPGAQDGFVMGAKWLRDRMTEAPLETTRPATCEVNQFSSFMCNRGTKGCVINHFPDSQ